MARFHIEKRKSHSRETDLSMIENIALDHVEIVHLRVEECKKKPKATPVDIVSSGARGMKAAIRGAVGVLLTFFLGYILLMLIK